MFIITNVNKLFKCCRRYKSYILNINSNLNWEYSNIEYLKFKNSYIVSYYKRYILNSIEYYNYLEKLHREDGPAIIGYHNNGKIEFRKFHLNGEMYYYQNYIKKIFN